jgi:hypothetical protein
MVFSNTMMGLQFMCKEFLDQVSNCQHCKEISIVTEVLEIIEIKLT